MIDQEALRAARAGRPLPSPVPSDADLWEGEEPFTAFGQFGIGRLDQRVFAQDTWWVDRLGRPHRLEQMSPQYQRNVLGLLLRSARQHWLAQIELESITAFTDALTGKVSYATLTARDDLPQVADAEPLEWLESTPLVRRLRHLTAPKPPRS